MGKGLLQGTFLIHSGKAQLVGIGKRIAEIFSGFKPRFYKVPALHMWPGHKAFILLKPFVKKRLIPTSRLWPYAAHIICKCKAQKSLRVNGAVKHMHGDLFG